MNLKLSQNAEKMANILLNHYPIQQSSHSSHEKQHQHMHDYRKERQIFQKPTLEKLQNMSFLKEQGNNHYKNERYKEAIYFYKKVIIYGDYTFPDNEADTVTMDILLQQSNCNMALSLIKIDKWEQAKMHLSQATIKGKDISIKCKGLYWLAKLYIRNRQFEKVKETIQQLRSLQKDDKLVEELEAMCKMEQTKRKVNNIKNTVQAIKIMQAGKIK